MRGVLQAVLDSGLWVADDGGVELSTRVRQLGEVLAAAGGRCGPELVELWVTGRLLAGPADRDRGADVAVILVVDLPVEELTWMHQHGVPYTVAQTLDLARWSMPWSSRPVGWPAWNQVARRVLRVWSADRGPETVVLDTLAAGDVESLPVVEPTSTELLEQLRIELAPTVAHLDEVVDRYWDHNYRRGLRPNPEQVLWHAACAVRDLSDAISVLDPPS